MSIPVNMKLDSYLLSVASFIGGIEQKSREAERNRQREKWREIRNRGGEYIWYLFLFFYIYNDLTLTTTLKQSPKTLALEVMASTYQLREKQSPPKALLLCRMCRPHTRIPSTRETSTKSFNSVQYQFQVPSVTEIPNSPPVRLKARPILRQNFYNSFLVVCLNINNEILFIYK